MSGIAAAHEGLNTQAAYLDWVKHFDNLAANQSLYARNYDQYLKNWDYALGRYQITRAFYEDGQIYGFCLKYMVDVTNPTAMQYSNRIRISTEEKTYEAEDNEKVTFSVGISGRFPSGSVVFQKADSAYQNYSNSVNNGLANAKFKIYCGAGENEDECIQTDKYLGVFAGKEASETGTTYVWSHHVGDEGANSGIIPTDQGLTELVTDENGVLGISGLDMAHSHYLVETEAPEGYYLDSTPVKFEVDEKNVLFKYVPNIARGIKVTKASSYDGSSVPGAEFMLYDAQNNQTLEGGFTKKITTVNGVSTTNYWYDKNAENQTLVTFENGDLNILGLPAGSYYLKETKAAPGYVLSEAQAAIKYSFTLPETYEELKNGAYEIHEENGFHYIHVMDSHEPPHHISKIFNDQKTKELALTKVGEGNRPLAGASFVFFKWDGTEAEWKNNPAQKDLWKVVSMNDLNSPYFQTGNTVEDVSVAVDGNGKLVIQGIPNGHYAMAETKAPEGYQILDNWLYFDVDVSNPDKIQLYWNLNHENPVKDNNVPNVLHPGALKLYKLVVGKNQDRTKKFDFTIALKDSKGNPVAGEFNATWFCKSENNDGETTTKTEKITFDSEGQCMVKLGHEEGITITGLPAGARYSITEAQDSSYELTMAGGSGTIPSQGTVIATARNRHKTGILRITKNVTGPGADREKEFEFELTMKDADGNGINGTFSYQGAANAEITPPASGSIEIKDGRAVKPIKLKAGQRISIHAIPDGTLCVVKETNGEGYTTKISVQDIHIDENGNEKPAEITNTDGIEGPAHITDNNRTDMNFNNIKTPEDGDLSISKVIDSVRVDETQEFTFHLHLEDKDGNPVFGTFATEVRKNESLITKVERVFEMNVKESEESQLTFDENGDAVFTLKHRDYLIIKDLPENTIYTLNEEASEGYESAISGNGTGEIEAGTSAVVTVTNYREEGNLIISKEVEGEGGDLNKYFKFHIQMRNADGTPLTGTYAYTYSGSSIEEHDGETSPGNRILTFDNNGQANISLKHGEKISISGLAKGVTYSVTEEAEEGYESSYTNGDGTTTGTTTGGTIQNNAESHACFTNRYKTGALRVLKNVTAGDFEQEFTFTVTLSDTTINGVYDEMTFVDGIATFTLKHGESKAATYLPAGIRYKVEESDNESYGVTVSNAEGTIEDKEIVRVQFNNTKMTNLIINKQVAGDLGDKTKAFAFTIELKNSDGTPLEGNYSYEGSILSGAGEGISKPNDGTLEFRDGKAMIALSHGQQIKIKNLPYQCEYTVTEEEYDDYQVTYNGEEAAMVSGTLEQTVTVNVLNTCNTVPNMGVSDNPKGIGILLGVGTLAVLLTALLSLLRKRRRS